MKSFIKSALMAALITTAGFTAFAQAPMGADAGMGEGHHRMHQMSPEKMKAKMEKRQADLKEKLKITAAQEGAWTTFTAAMKPPAGMMGQRPDRAAMEKLTTPERIDKMKAMRTEHQATMNAAMDQRAEATKTFYGALTAEQKTVFDKEIMRGGRHGGGEHHGRGDGPKKG
jgi:periplasmic protein CpxP/Spy